MDVRRGGRPCCIHITRSIYHHTHLPSISAPSVDVVITDMPFGKRCSSGAYVTLTRALTLPLNNPNLTRS